MNKFIQIAGKYILLNEIVAYVASSDTSTRKRIEPFFDGFQEYDGGRKYYLTIRCKNNTYVCWFETEEELLHNLCKLNECFEIIE